MKSNIASKDDLSSIRSLAEAGKKWLVDWALPLWSTHGFDHQLDVFEEQLDFDGGPIRSVPRRVMVQARQITVFASAALRGDFPQGRALAIAAGERMIANYLRADGQAGWVFSIDRDGRVVDGSRDLYAHAFVLFALAWLVRLSPERSFLGAIDESLLFLDTAFADTRQGGFWDCLPRKDALRRQNPHMHLFEALIELYRSTEDRTVLERCQRLDELAQAKLRSATTGAILEYFGDDWSVHPKTGEGSVEPGHQFEWAWLWRRYQGTFSVPRDAIVERLIEQGMLGLDVARGRIVDEMGEDGSLRKATSRSWPHAEAMKALSEEISLGNLSYVHPLSTISERLLTVYCRPDLKGGWMDHVSETDAPLSKVMPASSLYHLSFGIAAIRDLKPPAQALT